MSRRTSRSVVDQGDPMSETTDEAELLDAAADPMPEEGDHPDDVTDEEAEAGEVIYREIDDLDDDSNGLE
jgi:hypothetical protein